jgi:hypothetical protein
VKKKENQEERNTKRNTGKKKISEEGQIKVIPVHEIASKLSAGKKKGR